jgi:hypothetical protein
MATLDEIIEIPLKLNTDDIDKKAAEFKKKADAIAQRAAQLNQEMRKLQASMQRIAAGSAVAFAAFTGGIGVALNASGDLDKQLKSIAASTRAAAVAVGRQLAPQTKILTDYISNLAFDFAELNPAFHKIAAGGLLVGSAASGVATFGASFVAAAANVAQITASLGGVSKAVAALKIVMAGSFGILTKFSVLAGLGVIGFNAAKVIGIAAAGTEQEKDQLAAQLTGPQSRTSKVAQVALSAVAGAIPGGSLLAQLLAHTPVGSFAGSFAETLTTGKGTATLLPSQTPEAIAEVMSFAEEASKDYLDALQKQVEEETKAIAAAQEMSRQFKTMTADMAEWGDNFDKESKAARVAKMEGGGLSLDDIGPAGGVSPESARLAAAAVRIGNTAEANSERIRLAGVAKEQATSDQLMAGAGEAVGGLGKLGPAMQQAIQGDFLGAGISVGLAVLAESPAFGKVTKSLNRIVTILADMLAPALEILVPIAELIADIFDKVGGTLRYVFVGIAEMWNGIVRFIANVMEGIDDVIPGNIFKKKDFLKNFMIDLGGLDGASTDVTDSMTDVTDAAEEAAGSMLNVPEGFKVALRSFQSTDAGGVASLIPSGFGTSDAVSSRAGTRIERQFVVENMNVYSQTPDELALRVSENADWGSIVKHGAKSQLAYRGVGG